jgi:Tfp pilus assembly protein PilF
VSAGVEEKDRHIFPRWRSFRATLQLGELSTSATSDSRDNSGLDIALAAGIASWQRNPTLWRGLDLLGTATVAGKLHEFGDLVTQISRNPLAPSFIRNLFDAKSRPTEIDLDIPRTEDFSSNDSRSKIGFHRSNLKTSPADPIEWVELARHYTIVGANEKARRAILAALQLAPTNRFVLRSAARFFIHDGEPDRAHNLLTRQAITREDPWLLASEIAIAESIGKTSKLFRIAKSTIEMDIAPSQLTELASALGSIEAERGNHRLARKLLKQALVEANENAVAQIGWLNRSHLGESVDASNVNPPLLHEAHAWENFYKGEFSIAREEALRWLDDQPFASAPASLSSYILADLFGDFEASRKIVSAALKSNPDDLTLLNNYAVALMELGELSEAEVVLSRLNAARADKKNNAIYNATFGMLAFRKGKIEEGRQFYYEAIEAARNNSDKRTAARASIHLALEEFIARTTHIEESMKKIKEHITLDNSSEILWIVNRVSKQMERQIRE